MENNEMSNGAANNSNNNEKKGIKITTLSLIILIMLAIIFCIYKVFFDNEEVKVQPKQAEQVAEEITEVENEINEATTKPTLKMTAEEFPKVDGATAMLPMVKEMVKTVAGLSDAEADKYIEENTQGKSAKVYASLINKEKDLIFVSEPSDDILKQAKEKNVEFDMTGIGYDGFVFLLNEKNPVKSLTIEQIQKIYTGEITNWKEVGGDDAKIYAYQREANSGSQNLMEKMVMKGLKMKQPEETSIAISSMSKLVDVVSSGENSKYAIGYSIYLYAKEQHVGENVKFLDINGIEANDENITNKTYPLTKVVYAVTRKDVPEDSNVRKLTNWLLTPLGQDVVVSGGYVRYN
ncbi:MAG: substrate-binding domain-containing protein [Clostridia bacterium]|nr:substrate-binding domain-containing protein [Clostridia bacterium]